jgi:hypothetical protein
MIITKKCTGCQEDKALTEFYSTKAYAALKHKVDYYCKVCRNGHTLRVQRGPATRFCSVDNCDRRHYAKDYCRLHYDRVRAYGRVNSVRDVLGIDEEKQTYRNIDGKVVKGVIYSLENRLKNKFRMTVEEWLEYSKDGCNVCSADLGQGTNTNLHVDHDHACCDGKTMTCGKCTRGVVCVRCNTSIGLYEKGKLRHDYPNRDKIIAYLEEYTNRRKQEEKN